MSDKQQTIPIEHIPEERREEFLRDYPQCVAEQVTSGIMPNTRARSSEKGPQAYPPYPNAEDSKPECDKCFGSGWYEDDLNGYPCPHPPKQEMTDEQPTSPLSIIDGLLIAEAVKKLEAI